MIWLAFLLGAGGVLLSALFSGMETGFYRAVRLRLVLDAMAGDRIVRGLLFLTNHPSLFVATSLVGATLANYLVSLATVICLAAMFGGNSHAAELIATLVTGPFLAVYGEILPKKLFLEAPNTLLRRGGPVFLFFSVLFLPISAFLWLASRLLSRWFHQTNEPVRLVLAQRELRRILAEGHEAGILHPAQQTLAHGMFAVARKPVRQFLTPLAHVARARSNMNKAAVLRLAEHARAAVIPVAAADGSGRLIGCVRVIDLRLSDASGLEPLRPLLEVREDDSHLTALMRLESAGESMAQVVDRRGTAIGIVTIERLREPLL